MSSSVNMNHSRAAIGAVEFDTKIFLNASRIVTGRHNDAAIGLVFANEIGRSRRRQNSVGAHNNALRAIACRHAQDHLRRPVIEIAPIAAQHEGFAADAAYRGFLDCMAQFSWNRGLPPRA